MLDTVDLAIERVRTRVFEGGHNIPEDVIRRRYFSGIKNLFELYVPICDYWIIFDNSSPKLELVADGIFDKEVTIKNSRIFAKLKRRV